VTPIKDIDGNIIEWVKEEPPHEGPRLFKQAILLHHGIDMSANSWFSTENDPLYELNNPSEIPSALPIRLFEEGYDVWLANNRGVEHSLRH